MKLVLLLNSVGGLFCTYTVSIQYTKTTWPLTYGVLYAWMNGYSTLLYNIAPGKYIVGKYIVIEVEYGLQLHFKILLYKSDRKNKTKNNH